MSLGTIAYIPPDKGHPDAFLKNLHAYKTRYPIITYSDDLRFGAQYRIPNPKEVVKGRRVPLSINNYVFIRSVDVAVREGIEHYIYLEEDARVCGDYWDEAIFDEFFKNKKALMGGTPSIWNVGMCRSEYAIKAFEFAIKVIKKTGRPPLIWQHPGMPGEPIGLWCYPNGSCGVYQTATVASIFAGAKHDIGTFCATLGAWDVMNGKGLWHQFGPDVFELVAILKTVYSGYKDCHYGLEERKMMLTSGQVRAVHQIKTDWIP